jgi:hypothetical protein
MWKIGEAINADPRQAGSDSGMSFAARLSVKQRYYAGIEEVRLRVAAIFGVPSIKFIPNFERIFDEVKEVKRALGEGSYREEHFGHIGLNYFKDAFLLVVSGKFAKDALLCEGFRRGLSK